MEDERGTITNKNGKRKIIIHPLSIGNEGGIAGLLVFGGALAIAGFMAVTSFASNKDKTKVKGEGTYDQQNKPKAKSQELLLVDDGFKSEADHETTQDGDAACCWTSNMSMNQASSSDMLSAQTMILEEKIDLKPNDEEKSTTTCFHPQEIVFSDHSHPESATSSYENGVSEECLVSFFNSPSDQAEELDNDGLKSTTSDGSMLDLPATDTEDDDHDEDDDVDDDDVDEDDDDDDVEVEFDDVLVSGEEDSSKATTDSTSLDYNEEPIWPPELIQELPQQEFKGDYCDADDEAMIVKKEASLSGKSNFSVVLKVQPSALRSWVIPLLLLGLLLILVPLTRHPHESCVLDDVIL